MPFVLAQRISGQNGWSTGTSVNGGSSQASGLGMNEQLVRVYVPASVVSWGDVTVPGCAMPDSPTIAVRVSPLSGLRILLVAMVQSIVLASRSYTPLSGAPRTVN